VIYPSTLTALADHCMRRGVALAGLAHILSVGEQLAPGTRALAEAVFGARTIDLYSSEEAGCIAAQCPESDCLHVMAEATIAEIVNEDGEPCRPGEVGRVLVTDLHNYATPIVRYDIGDLAEMAAPCACGRELPAWARIVGRTRNLVLLPDGTRRWPITGFTRCRDIAPILQFQFVQHDRSTIEIRLVTERRLSVAEEHELRALFRSSIGHPFDVQLTYVTGRLLRAASARHEEFVCLAT
jgi:phenylacetate-CoA ligase